MLRFFATPIDFLLPNISSPDLQRKILTSENPIIEHNFGMGLGFAYFVKPDDPKLLETLLRQIHQQPDEHKTKSHTAWIAGGKNLLSLPTQAAMPYHNLFVRGLSHSKDYVAHTISALNEYDITAGEKIRLSTLTRIPIYHILAKGLFEIDQLPDDLVDAFQLFSDILYGKEANEILINDVPVEDPKVNLAEAIHHELKITHSIWILDYVSWGFRQHIEARDAYVKAASNFILSQYDKIKSDLTKYANNEEIHNILSLSVIEVIKQSDEHLCEHRDELNLYLQYIITNDTLLKRLLSDKFIQSVPSNIFAGENLQELLPCILNALTTKPELLATLRSALAEKGLSDDLSNMHAVIEADKKDNGILHRLYLEGMRLRFINPKPEYTAFGDRRSYYVTNPITINQTVIHGGSIVYILDGLKLIDPIVGANPQVFNPDRFITEPGTTHPAAKVPLTAFSYLPRRCPAYNVTEYIAKTFVSYLAMKFDFTLHARPNERQRRRMLLEFTSREAELKEVKEVEKSLSVSMGKF